MKYLTKNCIQRNVIVLVLLFNINAFSQAFVHPGLLNNKKELDFIKYQIKNNAQPWKTAFDRLKLRNVGAINFMATPRATSVSTSQMDMMTFDGQAAYSQALLWYFSDDKVYASNAIAILRDWSKVYVSTDNFLFLSWAMPHYLNAAEILRYSNSGWTVADKALFDQMLIKMKAIYYEPGYVNNIKMANIEAQMALAIYQDDRAEFNKAVARWRSYAPGYFYIKADGKKPLTVDGKLPTYWSHPISFITDGMSQETCQDNGHMMMGARSIFFAAEMARKQGIDLFSEQKVRLAAFMELHAGWSTGAVAVPDNVCSNHLGKILCTLPNDPTGPAYPNCGAAIFEVGYSQLAIRLGMPMPQSKKAIEANRPMGTGGKRNDKPETLTHGYLPVDLVTDIEEEVVEFAHLSVFPNPSQDGIFNLSLSANWKTYSVLGKELKSGNSNTINLSDYPKGVYLVKMNDMIERVVVE